MLMIVIVNRVKTKPLFTREKVKGSEIGGEKIDKQYYTIRILFLTD